MELARTTLRLRDGLKREAQARALESDTTLQDVFNQALQEYLDRAAKKKARTIHFKTHDLGMPLDNLTRSDFYPKV
jgi:hypothetical protein